MDDLLPYAKCAVRAHHAALALDRLSAIADQMGYSMMALALQDVSLGIKETTECVGVYLGLPDDPDFDQGMALTLTILEGRANG